ncbi:ribbon-helix-helix domain-containing protein [Azospirillum soli]|uniref:ribbon-helix-helix domain-containing protein n=1 Tax=Azospirillum soli TaxID=1304799 RepID=UPI001AE8D5C1|nr:ribbon-helix-helix domain-containing protein [Azospirillum soli]MBP2312949.1 putative DNA-binding ribbon-helix-helix protein [Azospirillum soli]
MLVRRLIHHHDRSTAVRLEAAFWRFLEDIAQREALPVDDLCAAVLERAAGIRPWTRVGMTPSRWAAAALRVFTTAYFQTAATDDGHRRAGHGRGDLRPSALDDAMASAG